MPSIQYSEDPKLLTAQRVVFWAVIGLAGVAVFGMLFGLIIQFLWNATVAEMFGIAQMSFWQAVGVFILAKILFGFGGGSSGSSRSGKSAKRRSKKTGDRADEAESTTAAADDERDFDAMADETAFRAFWQAEGKSAFEAYQQRRESADDESESKDQ